MSTQQPDWEYITNLGDATPLDYGGSFLYRDRTGVYASEVERLEEPCEDGPQMWTVYRYGLDRLKVVDGYLVPFSYAVTWSHPVKDYDEWFHEGLEVVARYMGWMDSQELRNALCSDDDRLRALAYEAIGNYHGFENLDSYPLQLTRAEVVARYKQGELG